MASSNRPKAPLKRDWTLPIAGVVLGAAFFVGFMQWLDYHGYFISPDAIYLNILAKSLWSHPYTIWFKRAYSYQYEIVHPDFTFPPLGPLLHWALEMLGVHTWHRGNWMTAFFMVPILGYLLFIRKYFRQKISRLT